MKWRRFLIGWRLWIRSVTARRMCKRLAIRARNLELSHQKEISELTKRYEYKLKVERKEKEILTFQFSDRMLEFMKLRGISYSIAEARTQVDNEEQLFPEPDEPLNSDARAYFEELREQFFLDGQDAGESQIAIESAWERYKSKAMAQTRAEFTQ